MEKNNPQNNDYTLFSTQDAANLTCDLVYLWVDGNDNQMREKRNFWRKKYNKPINEQAINECRFIDNEELKFSLRSVEKYAPWINNIYIITDNQIPKWLDTSNPRIHIVDHTEIMPKEALPTFNATAIEACMHKIHELSEYFLFANDDMFFSKATSFDFFFNSDGLPIYRIGEPIIKKSVNESMYFSFILYSYELIYKKFGIKFNEDPDHNITPYRKSFIEECVENFKKEFDYVTNCKFRESYTIQRTIYAAYSTVTKNSPRIKEHKCKIPIIKKFIKNKKDTIYFSGHSKKIIKKINEYKPNLICINDDENTHTEDRLRIKSILETLFPEKSDFEI